MYRVLAAEHGQVRERRAHLAHPAYQAPELLAERPNEVWSWAPTGQAVEQQRIPRGQLIVHADRGSR